MTVSDELPARLMCRLEPLQRGAVLSLGQEVLREVVTAHPPQRNGVLRGRIYFFQHLTEVDIE